MLRGYGLCRQLQRGGLRRVSGVAVRSLADSTQHTERKESKQLSSGKVKQLFNKYGYVAVGTYLSVYVATLSGLFFALDFDLLSSSSFGFDPITTTKSACDKIEYYTGITSVPEYIRQNPRAGTFAIAWIMAKFTEPIRLGITVMIVPKLGQYVYNKKHNDDV